MKKAYVLVAIMCFILLGIMHSAQAALSDYDEYLQNVYALEDATDTLGNNDGTNNGAVFTINGVHNKGALFTSDYIDFTDYDEWDRDEFTFCGWLNSSSSETGWNWAFEYGHNTNGWGLGNANTGVTSATNPNQFAFRNSPGIAAYAVSAGQYPANSAGWFHACVTYDSANDMKLYINGQLNATTASSDADSATTATFGRRSNSASEYWPGMLDEFYFWNTSLDLTAIQELSGMGDPSSAQFYPFSSPSSLTWESPTPADGTVNNTYSGVWINASCSTANVVHFWNGTLVANGSSPQAYELNNSLVPNEAEYLYWAYCQDDPAGTNSSRSWTLDTSTPTITIHSNNGFSTQNVTYDIYSPNLLINLSVQEDRSLFAFSLNITNASGEIFSYVNTSLSGTYWNWSKLIDVSSYGPDIYTVTLQAADSHTQLAINEYLVKTPKDALEFDTDEGINIKIKSSDSSTPSSQKLKDRYNFRFKFQDKSIKQRTFTVTSSSKIHYLPGSEYKAHFVTLNGIGGNWIDFEGVEGTPSVKKISDYEYTVTFSSLGDDVTFSSIGGLNVVTEEYLFTHSRYSLDSVTMDPTTPIVTDDLLGYARGSEGLGNPGYFNWVWYGNNTVVSSGTTGNLSQGATHNLANVSSNITTYGSNWTFSAQWVTMGNATAWQNSSTGQVSFQALNVTIRDENTGGLITENITVVVTGSSSETTVYTSTGSILISDLENGENSFSFSGPSYSQRTYIVTLTNLTQTLTVYLGANTSSTTFTVKDIVTGATLENVNSGMYRLIGGAWTPVETRYTDVTGRVVFHYIPDTYYRFVMAKSGYDELVFYLNPVVYSSYDIFLTPTETLDETQDFALVNIMWVPEIVYDAVPVNFTFLIQAPSGLLSNYGYNLTFPGGTAGGYGTNAIGGQLQSEILVVGASSLDKVRIDYFYTNTIDGLKEYTAYIPISANVSDLTLGAQQDEHYGMSFFERLFWLTIILIIVVGVPSAIGKPLVGGILGLFTLGVLVRTGFIELWLGLIPIFLGLIYLSAQGGR